MRAENPPLCGRDHLSYRSYYFPVKHVIDGKIFFFREIDLFLLYYFTKISWEFREIFVCKNYFSYQFVYISGDLCEQYNTLEASKQKSIAEELDRTPADVSKKLEDIRTRYAF